VRVTKAFLKHALFEETQPYPLAGCRCRRRFRPKILLCTIVPAPVFADRKVTDHTITADGICVNPADLDALA
jgi:hypothetical protein